MEAFARFAGPLARLARRALANKALRVRPCYLCRLGKAVRGLSADMKIEAGASMADRPIDLALEQPFRLGQLAVVPRSRELVAEDGTRRALEPRVMQVLIALARADGATVSREELIQACWN